MADGKDSKDLVNLKAEGTNILSNVSVSNIETTKNVARVMYTFLRYTDSEDENWRKIKHRLNEAMPEFIQKIQMAFIYYYAKSLELKYFKTNEDAKSPKVLADFAKDMQNKIEFVDSNDMYRYFEQLFDSSSSNHSAIASNEIASNFLGDTVQLKGKLLGLSSDTELKTDSMTADEFFANLESLVLKKEKSGFFNFADSAMHSTDPIQVATGKLTSYMVGLQSVGEKIGALEDHVGLLKIINSIEDPNARHAFVQFFERHSNDTVTTESWETLMKDFVKICNPGNFKHEKKVESETVDSVDALANSLALNIADYMTGKITADEFQRRDQEIRLGNDQTLNEENTETIL